MQSRLDNALILATGGKSNIMGGSVYSGSGGTGPIDNSVRGQSKWTDEQKQFAAMFGITDADIQKYSDKMPKYQGDRMSNQQWLAQ